MNFGFYGHTNTMIFTYTVEDRFNKLAMLGGMRLIYHYVDIGIDPVGISGQILSKLLWANPDSNEYRRDYYGSIGYEDVDKKRYLGIDEYLGYEKDTTSSDIFSIISDDPNAPIDLLFVWDGGYGELELPDCDHVMWASDVVLPDRAQFDKIADNCFLFLDANVLRKAGAMISRQISWERTASELMLQLKNNSTINYILKARQLLVSFDLDGAVIILPKGKNEQPEASIILTHGDIEGTIANNRSAQIENRLGFLVMVSTLVKSIVTSANYFDMVSNINAANDDYCDRCGDDCDDCIAYCPLGESVNIFTAIRNSDISLYAACGIDMYKMLISNDNDAVKWGGYLRAILDDVKAAIISSKFVEDSDPHGIIMELRKRSTDWPAFPIPLIQSDDSLEVPEDWTITNSVGEISDVALEYVQNGASAIEGLPQLSLGKFTTVDRWEIESYQNIRNLILDYANGESTRPLSIAVFGSPGSGKSFGVTEIAKNILPGKIEKLEFNVSQFTSLSDLGVAFQKVRDTILGGKLPLVFFDEFDSDRDGLPLGWVKSFLMPMQDGKFRDDSGEHPLGRCILVFAGGTAANFREFMAPMDISVELNARGIVGEKREAEHRQNLKDLKKEKELRYQAFKNIKGPDFISRLRGTIDVLSPNPKDDNDKNYILRRALLLRSLCERNNIASVSPNIIHAMLHVQKYEHGARSMEAILDMSRIDGNAWEPVSLPSRSQLSLHVDADDFIKLVLGNKGETAE